MELARHFAAPLDVPYPSMPGWSKQIIWGNLVLSRGRLTPGANAWAVDVAWGAAYTPTGSLVEWGVDRG